MHGSSMDEAREFKNTYLPDDVVLRIADIGAQDINGSLKIIFPDHEYVGFDIEAGNGVDVVMPNAETIPAESDSFDVVICANTIEHARRPWRLVQEMARIVKSGGLVWLLAPMPNAHRYHAHPIDCWRCYTEGMRGLFDDAGLRTMDLHEAADHDTVGVAVKP
jgi:SAM-dependent methyltransferase